MKKKDEKILGKKTSRNNEPLEEKENNKNKKAKISEKEKTNKQNTNQQNTTKSSEETDKYLKFKKKDFQCEEQGIINDIYKGIYTELIKEKKTKLEKYKSDFTQLSNQINEEIKKINGDNIKGIATSIFNKLIQIKFKNKNKKNLDNIKTSKTKEKLAEKVNGFVKIEMEGIDNQLKEYEDKLNNLFTDHNAVLFKKFEIKDDKICCSFETIDKDKMIVAEIDKEQLLKDKKMVGKIDEKKIEIDEAEWNLKFKKIEFQCEEQKIINSLYVDISKKITTADKKKYEDFQSSIKRLFTENMEAIKKMDGDKMEVIKDYLYENFLEKIEDEEYDEYKINLMEAIKKSNNKEEIEQNIGQWLKNTNDELNAKIQEYADKLNNFFTDHNAVVFDKFEIKDDKICCSFETIDKNKIIEAEIDRKQLLEKRKMFGKCNIKNLIEINEFDKYDISLEGDLLNPKEYGIKKELKHKNGTIISYKKKQNSECFNEAMFSATDRNGSEYYTNCTVRERTDDKKITLKKFLSATKKDDGTCDLSSKKYSYIEMNTNGLIEVPKVKPIADDKKVILYSMLEKEDLVMINRFKKKYKDKLQVIICEEKKEDKENVCKDNKKGDNEKKLIFKYDVSHLRIKPGQKKLDILLLKHGAYMKDGAYNLNLDVIINDIKKALEEHPQQIEQIYIKNYSCYNGLINNNKYQIVEKLEEMFKDLIQRNKISINTKIALSNTRSNDIKQVATTIDKQGNYGVRSFQPHVLNSSEWEVNMLTEDTKKNNERSTKGPEYRILKISRDRKKCEFVNITYKKFCEQFQRGTYLQKDHAQGYYDNLNRNNLNTESAQTQLPNKDNSMSKNG